MGSNVTIEGNVTRDPELKYANSGKALVRFGIADNYKKGDDETVSFYDVVAFEGLAENIAESLSKGDRVVVSGRQEIRKFDRNDGSEGTAVEIVANTVSVSLRWATVSITRNQFTIAGGQAAAPRGGGGDYQSPRRQQQPQADPGYGFDEEPF